LTLLAQEARPEDAEVKSEAAFQRLVASVSDLPSQPRTPRAFPDRGRYPEEAGREEVTREETPSDDDEPAPEEVPTNPPPSGSQPINIMQKSSSRTITPAASVAGSVYGDDAGMSISETSSSFGAAMDVDMVRCVVYQFREALTLLLPASGISLAFFNGLLSNQPMAPNTSSYNG